MVKQLPLNWHQINELAEQRAGDSAIVRKVTAAYERYPGLNILTVERLDHVDMEASMLKQRSTVYGIDTQKFGGVVNQMLGRVVQGSPHIEYQIRDLKEFAVEEIDKSRGVSYSFLSRYVRGELKRQNTHPAQKPLNGVVFGPSEGKTRHEMIARFAGMVRNDVHMPDDVTIAEMNRFVYAHEYQHARNRQTYDLAFFGEDPNKTTELEDISPNYSLLKRKFEGVLNGDEHRDAFDCYIDETMADTAAALHHLKAGGSLSLIEAVSNARACAYVDNADWDKAERIYASFTVLDKIVENHDLIADMVENTPEAELDVLAAGLVGDFAWGRREFYQNACAATLTKAREIRASESLLDEDVMKRYRRMVGGYPAKMMLQAGQLPMDTTSVPSAELNVALQSFGVTETLIQKTQDRANQGRYALTKRGPVTAEEHLVEVKAMLKYNQQKNPEFACAKGEEQLLRIRKAYLAEHADVQGRMANHPDEEQVVALIREEGAKRYGQTPTAELQSELQSEQRIAQSR